MSTLEIPTPGGAERPTPGLSTKMPIPKPGSNLEQLDRAEKKRRSTAGSKIRITDQIIKDVEAALATGTPLVLVADMIAVDRRTIGGWLRRGELASQKKWRERDQLDRKCLLLREAVRRAQGEYAVRVIGSMSQAAGLTREKPTETITRRTIRNPKLQPDGSIEGGEEVEVVIETREKAPDWKAAAHLAGMRFPEDLGSDPVEDEESGSPVTNQMLKDRLDQLRERQEAEAAEAEEGILEAEIVEESEPDPKQANGKKPR